MSSGAAGTNGRRTWPSGGPGGTSGGQARAFVLAAILALLAYAVVQVVANVSSIIADRRASGLPVIEGQIWVRELSSLAAWLCTVPLIWHAVAFLRPPRLSWPAAAGAQTVAALAAAAMHIALMALFRWLASELGSYPAGFGTGGWPEFVYELRKDVATYIQVALYFAVVQWAVSRMIDVGEDAAGPKDVVLSISDGARVLRVPAAQIDHVEAAGNYVEVHSAGRSLLSRSTLAETADALEPAGFARIHRSRLVRKDAIRAIEKMKSGDFVVVLSNHEQLRGSRRYRKELEL